MDRGEEAFVRGTMRIRILATAVADLEAAREFYDLQEPGVGDYFQDCLFSEIESLILHAGIHRKVHGYHHLLSKRFPYVIYYRIDEASVILVHRVLDCRRDPETNRKSPGPDLWT